MNPYLPLNKFIADTEPHVFDNKLYIYGSTDQFKGEQYCPLDYEVFYCDINDLGNFVCSGISYKKTDDPDNRDGKHCLYAPDVVRGSDGKYYLYYFIESIDAIKVAVSDKPEGPFSYYGDVKYCVDRESLSDYPSSFDPAVINDNGRIYLAFGFSVDFKIEGMNLNDKNTKGAYIVELQQDMLTMKSAPKLIVPGYKWGKNTSFFKHEFLEASSLRKFNNMYYFIYSSQNQHELCYAMSDNILGPYTYQGVLISNAYENGYKNNWANNHGSIEKIKDDYYIFYHRHSCGTQYSRNSCVERIEYDGIHFKQAKITSQGFRKKLEEGMYPASIACFVYDNNEGKFIGFNKTANDVARIENDKIVNIKKSTIVYRYFKQINKLTLYFDQVNDQEDVKIKINENEFKCQIIDNKMTVECNINNCQVELMFNCSKPITLTAVEVK